MHDPYVLTTSTLVPSLDFGPDVGWLLAVGVLGLGVGAFIAHLLLKASELARAQDVEHTRLEAGAAKALSAGPGRVVEGRVDIDGGEDAAFRIAIKQRVSNHRQKSSVWHVWSQESRRVEVRPFYLVHDDGELVYVEPSENALVVDSLTTAYPNEMVQQRLRTAEVRRGARFFAYGDLVQGMHPRAQGYRDGVGWVLRTPRSGRMLFATEAIRDRYRGRIDFLRHAGLMMLLAFVLAHAVFTAPFVAAGFFGTHELAAVSDARTYTTTNKGQQTRHYEITASADDGLTLTESVESGVYAEVKTARERGAEVKIPILRTGSWKAASYIGDRAYVSGLWIVLGLTASFVTLLVVKGRYPGTFAWYDKRTLTERGGPWYWHDTRPDRPIDPDVN